MNQDEFKKFAITMIGHAVAATNPATTFALGGLSLVQNLASNRAAQKAQAAFELLVHEIAVAAAIHGADPVEEQARVEDAMRDADPATIDTLLEGFRFLLSAIDPAAQPHIARLTARHFAHNVQRDWFFRRAGTLLSEVDATTLSQIVGLARCLHTIAKNDLGAFPVEFAHLTTCVVELSNHLPGYFETTVKITIAFSGEEGGDKEHEAPGMNFEAAELLAQALLVDFTDRTAGSFRLVWNLAAPGMFNRFVELFGT